MTLDLDRLAALERAASTAPWECSNNYLIGGTWIQNAETKAQECALVDMIATDADAELIAALRNAAPDLIAAARRLGEAEAMLAWYAEPANYQTPLYSHIHREADFAWVEQRSGYSLVRQDNGEQARAFLASGRAAEPQP